MSTHGRHRRVHPRRSVVATAAVVLCLVAVGGYFRLNAQDNGAASAGRVIHSTQRGSPAPSASPTISGVLPTPTRAKSEPISTPTHLTIASIGVSSDLQPLTLLPDRTLQSPSQWAVAGWYSGGVVPGQIGPAVIAGHVDSTRGPAVFFRLRDLVVGALISITERDGGVLRFVVDQARSYPKTHFPTTAVYGPAPIPELRLITCTGEFDRATGSYLNNLVVSAHLV